MKADSISPYTTAPSNPPSLHYEQDTGASKSALDHGTNSNTNSSVSSLSRNDGISSFQVGPIDSCNNVNLQNRLEHLKHWSVNTLKCTKQMIEEKLGTASVTFDQELEDRISSFRNMHQQYKILHNLAQKLTNSFRETLNHQRAFSNHMATLIVQQPELSNEFTYNTETQRIVISNGEKLLASLDHFVNSLGTLIGHAFTDTWNTVANMHSARVEYDAYRNEAQQLKNKKPVNGNNTCDNPTTTGIFMPRNEIVNNQVHDDGRIQSGLEAAYERYTELKKVVCCKLEFLQDNRLRVMQHQLVLLHNATSAFFSGNNQQLEQILCQYKIKLPGSQNGVRH
ncbi:unnamed protein product [Trichobilharzia szidati]|nr:unnamed protein product [Trichobilharzia szidati]